MPNDTTGTIWGLPNYSGALFTADQVNTPYLTMIGGLSGGAQTSNFEFPTDSEYQHETLAQENITEAESVAGVTPINFVRTQNTNVVQIFQEEVLLSYVKQSNQGRLSGLNTAGAANSVATEKDFQIATALEAIARKVEWHFLRGTYNVAGAANQANQTRGLIAAAALAGNTVAAAGALFSKDLFDALLLLMFNNGAKFRNMVLMCGGSIKQGISNSYGYAPESTSIGGLNIQQIETDFGNIAVAPAHRMVPAGTLIVTDVAVAAPVFQPVPGKGPLFYEELAKTGAADKGMLFGQIGLNYGPAFAHGTITGLGN